MKKWLKITSLSLLGLIVAAGVFTWIVYGSIIQGALSAEKLDDGMYYMEYKGDDGFKELMARGGSKDIKELADYTVEFLSKGYFKTVKIDCPLMPVGCSTLTVRTPEGGAMMARNFDYPYGPPSPPISTASAKITSPKASRTNTWRWLDCSWLLTASTRKALP